MSSLVPVLQAIARDQVDALRTIELGVVTEPFAEDMAVNVRLRDSGLELQHVPLAVGRIGLASLPRAGDLVVVGFVSGSLNGAVVLGSLYDDANRPPEAAADEVVYQVPEDQASDIRRVEIVLASGHTVTLDDETAVITMGGTTLTVEADGSITAEASGDVVLSAGGDVRIEAQGDVTASAQGNVDIEAMANLTAKASANATVEGSAAAKLKGATTTIAGMTQFSAG